jgi:hypothetical protein
MDTTLFRCIIGYLFVSSILMIAAYRRHKPYPRDEDM